MSTAEIEPYGPGLREALAQMPIRNFQTAMRDAEDAGWSLEALTGMLRGLAHITNGDRRNQCWTPVHSYPDGWRFCAADTLGDWLCFAHKRRHAYYVAEVQAEYAIERHQAEVAEIHVARADLEATRDRLRDEWEDELRQRRTATTTYVVRRERWVKIGRTKNLPSRLLALGNQRGANRPPDMTPGPVELVGTFGDDIESSLHLRWDRFRIRGTEWFKCIDELATWVERLGSDVAATAAD